jgi:O-antigen/teichoic acid export membrane protein
MFTVFSTAAFSAVAFLGYWTFDYWQARQFGTYEGRGAVHLALLLVPFIALSTSLGAAARNLGRLLTGQIIETGLRQILLLGILAAAALGFLATELSAESAMALHIVASILTVLVGIIVLLFACDLGRKFRELRIDWKAWSIALLPLSLIASLQVILGKSDLIMLRGIAGAEEVAIYFVANQLGNLVFLSSQAVAMVAGPMMSRAVQQGEMGTVQTLFVRCSLFVFVMALPMAVALLVAGEPILDFVYGAEFIEAYSAVIAFAAGYVMQALFGYPELLLKFTEHEWLVLRTMIIAIFANVGLNAILIPWGGALGAAVASMVVTLLVKFYLCLEIRRKTGVSTFAYTISPTSPDAQ